MDTVEAHLNEDFLLILEGMSDAFCAVDKEWRLIYVNSRAEQIIHCHRDNLIGKLIWDAFPETIGTALYEHYHRKSAEGFRLRIEVYCPQANAWLEVNAMPSPLGLAFYFRDVTTQRRSTADLEHLGEQIFSQHAYLETLLRHVPAGVMISEAPSGRVLYGNERMEEILGHPIVAPRNVEEYANWRGFHPDGRPYQPHEWPLARAITSGEVVSCEEIHIERLDGKLLALLVSAAPIRDRLGKILAGIVIDQDITERNQTADALRKVVRLEQQARQEAESAIKIKDQFIATLSHELRTPLTPVVMMLAAMELDPALPKHFEDDVAMLRRNVGIETKLIEDLLDVTSITNGRFRLNMEPTSIHAILASVTEIVGGDAKVKSQKLKLDLTAVDHAVRGDPVRLHQVFWNIIKNAIKFTPNGGEIEIRTTNPTSASIDIEVRDGGMGISQAAMPRIFTAFAQADETASRQFGGLGLGLTISKAIVDLHGGTIHAESAGEGAGTCFRVELRTVSPVTAPGPKAPRQQQPLTSALRILVVEDHQDTARVLCRLLRSMGYAVASAGSVAAALSYATGNEIDVLVSDIGLPDATGRDLIWQLRQIQDVPAIAVSGYGSADDIESSRHAGFFAHLTKPLDFDLLHTTIQRAAQEAGPQPASSAISAG